MKGITTISASLMGHNLDQSDFGGYVNLLKFVKLDALAAAYCPHSVRGLFSYQIQ